jgi:acyl carrier protein
MMQDHERLRRFIRDAFLVDDFADGDSFLTTGIVDSLGILQLVSFVEAEFGIRVEDAELVPENFDSLEKVAAFVGRKRAAHAA